jgi:hypothetical protein
MDLDFEVNRAAKDRPHVEENQGQTLVPAEVTTRARDEPRTEAEVFGSPSAPAEEHEPDIDLASVFSKLKDIQIKE